MINTHEREDAVQQRTTHTKNNSSQELSEPSFAHFTKKNLMSMLHESNADKSSQEMLLQKGHHGTLTDTIEFHVDDSDLFIPLIGKLPLRGMTSIRKNPTAKIRIVVGQNESICFPHSLKFFYWTIEGNIPLRTKTEGTGIMISLMTAREFGFAFSFTDKIIQEVLAIVNENRKNSHCLNTKAAMDLHVTTEKNTKEDNTLTSNPFYRDF